jgi:hypothetical protein
MYDFGLWMQDEQRCLSFILRVRMRTNSAAECRFHEMRLAA